MQRKALLMNVLGLFEVNNRLQYTAVVAFFLAFILVAPSYANSIDEPSQGNKSGTSLPIVFPSAPNNTPYKQIAGLGFIEPTATFMYASEHPDQYAAYWRANNTEATAKGVVVFIHGGCWLSAFDMSHAYAFATGLSQAGYHVWSIEYRRAGNGGEWPVALEDIVLGLQKIEVLSESDVNLDHISVVGHSAGGHLAAMLAVQLQDVLPALVKKADVIGLAAIIDVAKYASGSNDCQTATPSFMAGMPNQKTSAYYLATPSNFEARGETLGQFQLLQGNADVIVPELQASHYSAKTIKLDGVGHFDWIHPGSDAFKQLLKQLEINATN
jgi:acetyl esterase/lipase